MPMAPVAVPTVQSIAMPSREDPPAARPALAEVRWLSVADVAERFDVSRKTVYRLIAAGKLPAQRLNRTLLIDPADLAAVLRPARRQRGRTRP